LKNHKNRRATDPRISPLWRISSYAPALNLIYLLYFCLSGTEAS